VNKVRYATEMKLKPYFPLRSALAVLLWWGGGIGLEAGGIEVAESREILAEQVISGPPQWSPNGDWIAFPAEKGNGIWIVKPDGTGLRKLTDAPGSGYQFAWSPDGVWLACRVKQPEAGPRQYVVRVISAENGEIESTSAVMAEGMPPQWQCGPEGIRWVASVGENVREGAWLPCPRIRNLPSAPGPAPAVRKADGLWLGNRKVGGTKALHPRWNARGTQLLLDQSDMLTLVDPAQSDPASILCVGQHPAWSPSGTWIAYQLTRDHTHEAGDDRQHTADTLPHLHDDKTNHQIVDSDLWLIRPDGTARHALTSTPDIHEVDPSWSPDGLKLVCRMEGRLGLRILTLRETP
jgi:hypothetical protein